MLGYHMRQVNLKQLKQACDSKHWQKKMKQANIHRTKQDRKETMFRKKKTRQTIATEPTRQKLQTTYRDNKRARKER